MFRHVKSFVTRALAWARRPRRRQAAALCWRHGDAGVEILLITTRRTGRWTPPKGGLITKKSAAETAAQEAWEEAGVIGAVDPDPIGFYEYMKFRKDERWERLAVDVFALEVEAMETDFPEEGERLLRWAPQARAASLVREKSLSRIIRSFAPPTNNPLAANDAPS